jgi:hypothetical protein
MRNLKKMSNLYGDFYLPVATITAVGVARPRAQGQAMERTVIAKRKANSSITSILLGSFPGRCAIGS